MPKNPGPNSNVNDPAFWAKWQPWREKIKPKECDHGEVCWVTRPYAAITPNQNTPRCTGCGGLIDRQTRGRPPSGYKK